MKIEFISSSGRFNLISQTILSYNTHTVTHPFTKKILCIVTLIQTHINKQYVHVIRCILIYWSYVYALHTEAQTHTGTNKRLYGEWLMASEQARGDGRSTPGGMMRGNDAR